jgi:hypothetical protein
MLGLSTELASARCRRMDYCGSVKIVHRETERGGRPQPICKLKVRSKKLRLFPKGTEIKPGTEFDLEAESEWCTKGPKSFQEVVIFNPTCNDTPPWGRSYLTIERQATGPEKDPRCMDRTEYAKYYYAKEAADRAARKKQN